MSSTPTPADLGTCEYECKDGVWELYTDGSVPNLSHCPLQLGGCIRPGARMVIPAIENTEPPAESSEEKTE